MTPNKDNKIDYPDKVKSDELDKLKQIDDLVCNYNKTSEYHYFCRVLKAVKKGWF